MEEDQTLSHSLFQLQNFNHSRKQEDTPIKYLNSKTD